MTELLDLHPDFGITQSLDKEGNIRWNINILVDESGTQRLAVWDQMTGLWRLDVKQEYDILPSAPNTTSDTSKHKPNMHLRHGNWTDSLIQDEHTRLFCSLDWSKTALGPCSHWPNALRLYTHTLFSDSRAACIYWGRERLAICNGRVPDLIGAFHPTVLGNPFEEVMPQLWDLFRPHLASIEKTHTGYIQNAIEVPLQRKGYVEETWWDGGLVELKDDYGDHGGVYFSLTEVTRAAIQDRRSSMINKLALIPSKTMSTAWPDIFGVFSQYKRDFPMAIFYSASEDGLHEGQICLRHTIGISTAYMAAPETMDLLSKDKVQPLASLMHQASNISAEYLLIDTQNDQVDPIILNDVDWQGFGEPSRYLVIIPLRAVKIIRGYVVVGLNSRLGLDEDHEQHVAVVARQLSELIQKVTTEENTLKREGCLREELYDTERRVSRLAEVVPVGIYELGADGALLWANSQFWEIFQIPVGQRDPAAFAWHNYIHPEDICRAGVEMGKSLMEAVDINDSLRLQRSFAPPQLGHDPPQEDEPFWIMYAASPHLRPDGSVHSLMGSLTDISHLKWVEQLHYRNAEAAKMERKRQEEFIDITSHELRNPLSAITQCADSVISSLQEARIMLNEAKTASNNVSLLEIIKVNAEAAESILFCAAHQRRIIDDVLTLGKMDSRLLTISPKAFQPGDLVQQAVQMFGQECGVNNISLKIFSDASSILAPSANVYGDPSRLMQIMVNLLSNAIKFTRTRPTREVSIRSGTSDQPPSTNSFGPSFQWYSTGTVRPDLTQEPDYGRGKVVYLYYAVSDTGRGILPQFIENVFTKFSQGERRTHTEYGGSGIGLYVSQELTELQGGSIGIQSEAGVGSTFAFYTKTRLALTENKNLIDPTTSHMYNAAKTNHAIGSIDHGNDIAPYISQTGLKYNILLVEDNILNQKVLTKQLRKTGCMVQVCSNGGEAVDAILQLHGHAPEYGTAPQEDIRPFDCVLMDWEMPVCDGIKASKRIREIEANQNSKANVIIGVTANARAEQIATAQEAGMTTVMTKPFRVVELLTKIGELVVMPG